MQPLSYELNTSIRSLNESDRGGNDPSILVMHHTACPERRALDLLTRPDSKSGVSAHYLVSEDGQRVWNLVPEDRRAWHAGKSYWSGETDLNWTSIGIENVNWGITYGYVPPEPKIPRLVTPWTNFVRWQRKLGIYLETRGFPVLPRCYPTFSREQMNTTIQISQIAMKRWNLDPWNVVAHHEIALGRKVDPNPEFGWELLAEYGVGLWPQANVDRLFSIKPQGISPPWMQKSLADWGYKAPQTGVLDSETCKAIQSFQRRYRPEKHSGVLDCETQDRLEQLICQRRWLQEEHTPRQCCE